MADGVCDLGIVGENVLEEGRNGGPNASIVMPLGFGRCTLKIATPPTLTYDGPASLDGLRIATSYPKILRRFLDGLDEVLEKNEVNGMLYRAHGEDSPAGMSITAEEDTTVGRRCASTSPTSIRLRIRFVASTTTMIASTPSASRSLKKRVATCDSGDVPCKS